MKQVLTVKEWFITIIISILPVIGFIMIIYWGFLDAKANINKKNWAKAFFFVQIAGMFLAFLAFLIGSLGALTSMR